MARVLAECLVQNWHFHTGCLSCGSGVWGAGGTGVSSVPHVEGGRCTSGPHAVRLTFQASVFSLGVRDRDLQGSCHLISGPRLCLGGKPADPRGWDGHAGVLCPHV